MKTLVMIGIAALIIGCQSSPIQYGGYLVLPPNKTVKMGAPANSKAYAIKVNLGADQQAKIKEIIGEAEAKDFTIGGPIWLMYNADIVKE